MSVLRTTGLLELGEELGKTTCAEQSATRLELMREPRDDVTRALTSRSDERRDRRPKPIEVDTDDRVEALAFP